jgi:murein DD-endopeptidase MepM/ murein hydrolase activator NlpD
MKPRWLRRLVLVGVPLLAIAIWLRLPLTLRVFIEYWDAPAVYRIPVEGVRAAGLRDSWHAPRPGGRRHEGIDIFARRGTPVVATAPGRVIKVGHNRLGGNVVTVAGAGAQLYYYAHLERFAAVEVGDKVRAGTVLGYVGNTGNAAGTPPHLHFGVYPLRNALRAVNPYPLLAAHTGRWHL